MTQPCFEKDRAWIELDMAALRHNVNVIKASLPQGCELMPAVKADAYGHGAALIARELNALGVRAFCVATVSEGVELRESGVSGTILILGYTHPAMLPLLAQYDLTQTIVDYDYARLLSSSPAPVKAHIAVDTGMHRIGERCENHERILEMFGMAWLDISGVYTHLCADDTDCAADRAFTHLQAQRFQSVTDFLREHGYAPKAHILGSYGLINYPQLGGDYARVGIALYGVLSSAGDELGCRLDLRPVLSAKARVSSVRRLEKGEGAGYGLEYTAPEGAVLASLAIGYADGLPRALSCGAGSVLINGHEAPIAGRICMDQTMVDVSGIPDVRQGDLAVIIGSSGGRHISAADLAERCGTITNELLSRLGARLPRLRCGEVPNNAASFSLSRLYLAEKL